MKSGRRRLRRSSRVVRSLPKVRLGKKKKEEEGNDAGIDVLLDDRDGPPGRQILPIKEKKRKKRGRGEGKRLARGILEYRTQRDLIRRKIPAADRGSYMRH